MRLSRVLRQGPLAEESHDVADHLRVQLALQQLVANRPRQHRLPLTIAAVRRGQRALWRSRLFQRKDRHHASGGDNSGVVKRIEAVLHKGRRVLEGLNQTVRAREK